MFYECLVTMIRSFVRSLGMGRDELRVIKRCCNDSRLYTAIVEAVIVLETAGKRDVTKPIGCGYSREIQATK